MSIFRLQRHVAKTLSSNTRPYLFRRAYCPLEVTNGPDILDFLIEAKSKSPETIDPASYYKILHHSQPHLDSDKSHQGLDSGTKAITSTDMAYLYNVLIQNFAKHDYSIATVARNALSKLPIAEKELNYLDIDSLLELIRYNPGRVLSSWEIFMNDIHLNPNFQSSIKNSSKLVEKIVPIIIDKLLHGDFNEINEGFKADVACLSKIYFVIHHYKNSYDSGIKFSSDLEDDLLEKSLELDFPWLIDELNIPSEKLLSKLTNERVSNTAFAILFKNVWKQNKDISDFNYLTKVLPLICQISAEGSILNGRETKSWKEFHSETSKLGVLFNDASSFQSQYQRIMDEMISNLNSTSFEKEKISKIQSMIIHCYGVYKKDLVQAELFYNEFVKQGSRSAELIGALSLVYCYHACIEKSVDRLNLAASLFESHSKVPTRNLQALILANAYLEKQEASLESFNAHIKNSSKKREHSTKSSDAVSLTESLVLGYLYNLDREFAYLIHDGAVMNSIIDGEEDILRFKALFKLYGQAFEEDDTSKARIILGRYLIESLKAL